jgi:asparagine synthase (glutamine-hydrolysing)
MCGICGFVGTGEEQTLLKMQDRLKHRGPDDKGHYYQTGLGLANSRLSIIDLKGGHQPVYNEKKNIWVVYNGEIYNFPALRDELQKSGHQFYTQTDTEVIVHAYEEWGDHCIRRFRGMFAFALWDASRNRLLLARDRLGIKPLFYSHLGHSLIFASEIKSLLEHPGISRALDPLALDLYMRLQFVPSPYTIFRQIRKLPPAHYLVLERGNLTIHRYWELRFEPVFRSETQWLDALEEKFLETVKSHLISDVPLGAFLSGGTDSTAVVLAMSRCLGQSVKTFCIGFSDPRYDERSHAKWVADFCGSHHCEDVIPRKLDPDFLRKLFMHLDEPMSDISVLPTYMVSQLARTSVPVVLTGDGGDETFGGYEKYERWLVWQAKWGKFSCRNSLGSRVQRWMGRSMPVGKSTLSALGRDSLGQFAELTYQFYSLGTDRLYGDEFRNEIHSRCSERDIWKRVSDETKGEEPLSRMQHADFLTYLPEDILTKVDRMSMFHSLEVRVPFLDHEFQELVAKVPANLKYGPGKSKVILKKLLERWGVPASVLDRKKTGFAPSFGYWLSPDWVKKAHEELVSGRGVKSGMIMRRGVDEIVRRKKLSCLWNLWVFEIWAAQYLGS